MDDDDDSVADTQDDAPKNPNIQFDYDGDGIDDELWDDDDDNDGVIDSEDLFPLTKKSPKILTETASAITRISMMITTG